MFVITTSFCVFAPPMKIEKWIVSEFAKTCKNAFYLSEFEDNGERSYDLRRWPQILYVSLQNTKVLYCQEKQNS